MLNCCLDLVGVKSSAVLPLPPPQSSAGTIVTAALKELPIRQALVCELAAKLPCPKLICMSTLIAGTGPSVDSIVRPVGAVWYIQAVVVEPP